MQLLEAKPQPEEQELRRWIYVSLAILSALATTWALHVTQESWRPAAMAQHERQIEAQPSSSEIEALEAELDRIQQRLDDLRSNARP
jgi:hypothetical protein